jgi:hypothetical protein
MRKTALGLSALLVICIVTNVLSSPIISITTQPEWQEALDNAPGGGKAIAAINGFIQPVSGWSSALEHHYPGMSTQQRDPNLQAMIDVNPIEPGNQEGLMMAWGSSNDLDNDIIAAWEYVYDVDPDFSNALVDIDAHPPCFTINSISIGLKDVNGNLRSWAWNVPSTLPCGVTTHITVNPSQGSSGASPPANSYYNDVAFDITQVVSIEFCENGTWVAGVPADPAGFGQNVWNYWQNLVVTTPVPVEQTAWEIVKGLYRE